MRIVPTREELVELTAGWDGPRSGDGRPRVDDEVLAVIGTATTEQAWHVLQLHGYDRQFAGGWRETCPGRPIAGRAMTARFVPHRPDLDATVVAAGARDGHLEGDRQNAWVIDRLGPGDVMVVDIFGKVAEGTVIGDNLGTALASRTGVGAVIDGGVRDLQGLAQLETINVFMRGVDPTPIRHVTLAGINLPVRIGGATVLPGDAVLGTPSGVIFIPPHLAVEVARVSGEIGERDRFAKLRLAQGVYTSAQIDVAEWPEQMESDFAAWRASPGAH